MKILAGFEIPSGNPVNFEIHHTGIFGMTQKAGKTTLLEGLVVRSKLSALAFITKRGESGFHKFKGVPPYYKANSDWQWLEGLVNVALGEKVKYEPGMRGAIIRVSEGTDGDLAKILAKSMRLERDARRDFIRTLYHNLSTYLRGVVENMSRFLFVDKITLAPGEINVMDLSPMEQYPEIQQIVIAASINYVHEKMMNIVVVVPEAWEQLPQGKMTPVKWAAERFIRKGGAIGNWLVLDSQDIGGIDKTPLRQVDNWFFGRMKEAHEVERIGKQLLDVKIPASEIQTLELGHFYAVIGNKVFKIYALPAGVPEEVGKLVAQGRLTPEKVREQFLKQTAPPPQTQTFPVQTNPPMPNPFAPKDEGVLEKMASRLKALEEKAPPPTLPTGTIPASMLRTDRYEPVTPPVHIKTDPPINIQFEEQVYKIHHEEMVHGFTTKNGLGQIMFVVANTLKGGPASEAQISTEISEYGWKPQGHSTLAPNLAKLVKAGSLVKETSSPAKYRTPKKARIEFAEP